MPRKRLTPPTGPGSSPKFARRYVDEATIDELFAEVGRRVTGLLAVTVSVGAGNSDVWSYGYKGSNLLITCMEAGLTLKMREVITARLQPPPGAGSPTL